MSLTLDDIQKAISQLKSNYSPKEYTLFVGASGSIYMSFTFASQHLPIRFHNIIDDTKKYVKQVANGNYAPYELFIPYYKGNLYTIRHYLNGSYKVFYATKELLYATTLKDCIDNIPVHVDKKHEQWKLKNKHI